MAGLAVPACVFHLAQPSSLTVLALHYSDFSTNIVDTTILTVHPAMYFSVFIILTYFSVPHRGRVDTR